jgi:probable DNA metabolism protein
MIIYEIDNTLFGLYSAVFESYEKKEIPDIVTSKPLYQMPIGTKIKKIETDEKKANRVQTAIIKYAGEDTVQMLKIALKSCLDEKETICFNYIKKVIDSQKDIAFDYGDFTVMEFTDLKAKVGLEAHRFKGFLRFSETENGVLYAHYSPDNDITELIAHHFKKRFKYHAFIIHDEKRNIVAMYDTKTLKCFTPPVPLTVYINETEENYRKLWKEYFDAVNIKERKNKKLQDNYLPRRYRKNLTEF